MSANCPVCDARSTFFAAATVLSKYAAEYRRCPRCQCVFVSDPHWLTEAYSTAIATTDIGLPARSVDLSYVVSLVITIFFREGQRFLDYAGGNGLLVRLLRDRGYDFAWSDPYADNLFAKSLEGSLDETYDVITAIEVLEHLPHPGESMQLLFRAAPVLIATTELLPDPPPSPSSWWYYSLATGQHIIFYAPKSLEAVASEFGKRVSSAGSVHVFCDRSLPAHVLRLATSAQVARSLNRVSRRKSLLRRDYHALTGQFPD